MRKSSDSGEVENSARVGLKWGQNGLRGSALRAYTPAEVAQRKEKEIWEEKIRIRPEASPGLN